MTDKAYRVAYQRGYRAGLKSGKSNNARMTDQQFFDEAMLRLLPTAMLAENWTMNGKQVQTSKQRVELCVEWCQMALAHRGKSND